MPYDACNVGVVSHSLDLDLVRSLLGGLLALGSLLGNTDCCADNSGFGEEYVTQSVESTEWTL